MLELLELLKALSSIAAILSVIALIRPIPLIRLPTRGRAFQALVVSLIAYGALSSQEMEDEYAASSPEDQAKLRIKREKEALVDSFLAIKGKKFGTSEFYDMKQKYGKYGEFTRLEGRIPDYTIEYSEGLNVSFVLDEVTEEIIFTGKGKAAEDYVKKKIEKGFNSWNGTHRELTKQIKEMMNDPDSLEHLETKYLTFRDYMIVIVEFRGKNAFGAIVKDKVRAKVSYEGDVLEITSPRGPTLSTGKYGGESH